MTASAEGFSAYMTPTGSPQTSPNSSPTRDNSSSERIKSNGDALAEKLAQVKLTVPSAPSSPPPTPLATRIILPSSGERSLSQPRKTSLDTCSSITSSHSDPKVNADDKNVVYNAEHMLSPSDSLLPSLTQCIADTRQTLQKRAEAMRQAWDIIQMTNSVCDKEIWPCFLEILRFGDIRHEDIPDYSLQKKAYDIELELIQLKTACANRWVMYASYALSNGDLQADCTMNQTLPYAVGKCSFDQIRDDWLYPLLQFWPEQKNDESFQRAISDVLELLYIERETGGITEICEVRLLHQVQEALSSHFNGDPKNFIKGLAYIVKNSSNQEHRASAWNVIVHILSKGSPTTVLSNDICAYLYEIFHADRALPVDTDALCAILQQLLLQKYLQHYQRLLCEEMSQTLYSMQGDKIWSLLEVLLKNFEQHTHKTRVTIINSMLLQPYSQTIHPEVYQLASKLLNSIKEYDTKISLEWCWEMHRLSQTKDVMAFLSANPQQLEHFRQKSSIIAQRGSLSSLLKQGFVLSPEFTAHLANLVWEQSLGQHYPIYQQCVKQLIPD